MYLKMSMSRNSFGKHLASTVSGRTELPKWQRRFILNSSLSVLMTVIKEA